MLKKVYTTTTKKHILGRWQITGKPLYSSRFSDAYLFFTFVNSTTVSTWHERTE